MFLKMKIMKLLLGGIKMGDKTYLDDLLFMDGVDLIQNKIDRALVWEQAFDAFISTKYYYYHECFESHLSDIELQNLTRDAYWYANKMLEEYIIREYGN